MMRIPMTLRRRGMEQAKRKRTRAKIQEVFDRFPALLSAGEHVWTAEDVRRMGGRLRRRDD